MTRGRSSTLVTHLLMCNKLYNLIFLGDKRMICNRISALMSTHIYINTGCFIGNDHTYRKDLTTNGTVRPKGIAHRQSRLIEALISNASLASLAYLHYLHHLYFFSTPPASKSPAPIMDLGAQDQQKNPKSEGLQWDLGILELDLRFRGGLGSSPTANPGTSEFSVGLELSSP